MKEEEIDEKINDFRGPISKIDDVTSKQFSKALVNPEDENVTPEKETYKKLLKLAGGVIPVIIYIFSSLIYQFG